MVDFIPVDHDPFDGQYERLAALAAKSRGQPYGAVNTNRNKFYSPNNADAQEWHNLVDGPQPIPAGLADALNGMGGVPQTRAMPPILNNAMNNIVQAQEPAPIPSILNALLNSSR